MRNFLFPFTTALALLLYPVVAGDYELTIDGKKYDVTLDQEIPLELENGTKLNVKLEQKEYVTFRGKGYRFEHHKSLLPSVSDLGDGILQLLMATPRGTGVMIQTYEGANPSPMVGIMINEFTSDDVAAGYELTKQKTSRKVGEHVFRGSIATTTSEEEDSEWVYEVVALGTVDGGMMIMTFMEKDNKEADAGILERFWKTVAVEKD